MKPGYEVTAYGPSMKSDIAELTKHLWSPDTALNAAHFAWRYERNPYVAEPLLQVALFEGRVVAMRGLFGMRLECGVPSTTHPALYADDLVIAPEHRNHGLVAPILRAASADAARRGYTHLFNLSTSSVTRMASLAAGWKTAGVTGVHDWRPANTPRARGVRAAVRRVPVVRWLARRVSYRPWAPRDVGAEDVIARQRASRASPQDPIAVEASPRPAEMADLIARLGHDGRIRHVRDETYLSWRYGSPLNRYLFLTWRESKLDGYLVLRKRIATPTPRPTGFQIADWEATTPAIRAALLRRALALCAPTIVSTWTATLPPETVGLLRDAGFSRDEKMQGVAGYEDWILVRPTREQPAAAAWMLADRPLLDVASWDLRMIYSTHG